MTKNYKILIKQIQKFIKKYYLIKTIQNSIISIAIILIIWLIIAITNYYLYLETKIKTILFYAVILLLTIMIFELIIIPLLKMLRIIKGLNEYQAAKLISNLNPEYEDKIINILELANNFKPSELILASIEQKIKSLKLLDFSKLLSTKEIVNKYLKYLIGALALITLAYIINPNYIKQGTIKFIKYNEYFQAPAPFNFELLNGSLITKENQNFTIKLRITGKYIPNTVIINLNGANYLMKKENHNTFSYQILNPTDNQIFYFYADGHKSKTFQLKVIKVPKMINFSIQVYPPKYTNIKPINYQNITNISVPFGSQIIINGKIKNSEIIKAIINQKDTLVITTKNNKISIKFRILKNSTLILYAEKNNIKTKILTLKFSVKPDLYPKISVQKYIDSSNFNLYYFIGHIEDDYGFSKLTFNYQINDKITSIKIPIEYNIPNQNFYFQFNFQDLNISENQKVLYYFEIFDNDYISGYKSTKTPIEYFKIPSATDITKQLDSTQQLIENQFYEAQTLAKQIQQDIEKLQEQLLNQNLSEWQKRTILTEILQKQLQLQELIENIKQQNQLNFNKINSFYKQSEQILQKYQQIQQLLDELLNDELKQLIEQIQNMLQNLNDPKLNQKLQNIKLNYNSISKQLEQQLEQLKRLAIEQKINQQAQALEQLAKQIDSLNKLIQKKQISKEQLLKQQQNLINQLKQQEQLYQKTLQQNKTLQKPYKLPDLSQDFQNINQNLQQAQQQTQKNRLKKTQKIQQNISKQLQQLSQKLQQAIKSATMEISMEDIQLINNLIIKLLDLSFQTEKIYQSAQIYTSSNKLSQIATQVAEIEKEFKIIADSLYSLTTRNPQISKPINQNIRKIFEGTQKTIQYLNNRIYKKAIPQIRQIYTAINNITLILTDLKQQLDKLMQQAIAKPGTDTKNANSQMQMMKNLQQSLQQQLQKMLEDLKQGKLNSKELVEALKMQQMLQQLIDQFMQNNTLSPELTKTFNQIKDLLEKTQKDIINQQITPETIKRQNQIRIKLLEAEKALKEQGFDNKRKAETAQNIHNRKVKNLIINLSKNSYQKEILQLNTIKLNSFYINKYSKYINSIR